MKTSASRKLITAIKDVAFLNTPNVVKIFCVGLVLMRVFFFLQASLPLPRLLYDFHTENTILLVHASCLYKNVVRMLQCFFILQLRCKSVNVELMTIIWK